MAWRTHYFSKMSCEGKVVSAGNGEMLVQGRLRNHDADAKIIYWAASPPGYRTSYTGAGLPFPNPEVAYENTPNKGVAQAVNGAFEFRVHAPNAYYTGLGSVYMPPHILYKVCDSRNSQKVHTLKLGEGIPYRTMTYPSHPVPRATPEFYKGREKIPARSQEQILRDSGYPLQNKYAPNFWGLAIPHP